MVGEDWGSSDDTVGPTERSYLDELVVMVLLP
jgi:hypothetical protein